MDDGVRERQMAAMEEYDLDVLVAYSKENVLYGAGYPVPSQTLGIHNRQFCSRCQPGWGGGDAVDRKRAGRG